MVYSKKVTSEEAREGYVLVLKNQLSFFPGAGRTFRLVRDGRSTRVKVESYHCTCRGPEEPHRHFFIRSKGLKTGDQVIVRKDGSKDARYMLLVHRKHSI
jgi:hypothetical protein